MRMLEEILEEIEQGKSLCKILGREVYVVPLDWIKTVIFKYINSRGCDGWIPVKERLPEEHEESRDILDADTLAVMDTEHNMVSDLVQCTVYDAKKDEYFVCDDCTVNGKWCNLEGVTGTYKVIAWQPLPEPYRLKDELRGDVG